MQRATMSADPPPEVFSTRDLSVLTIEQRKLVRVITVPVRKPKRKKR